MAEHLDAEDREHAERLIAQVVEYEGLARAMERQGATPAEMERIEDASWPVREVLRQLDEKLPETVHRCKTVAHDIWCGQAAGCTPR